MAIIFALTLAALAAVFGYMASHAKAKTYYMASYVSHISTTSWSSGNLWVSVGDGVLSINEMREYVKKKTGVRHLDNVVIISFQQITESQYNEFNQPEDSHGQEHTNGTTHH